MSTGPTSPQYRADVDGLRALAIVGVLLFHAFPALLPGGYVGVDVFFVISGFLIGSILSRELDLGQFSYLNFLLRRARRLLPALLVVLAVSMGVAAFLLVPEDLVNFYRHALSGALFIPNLVLWGDTGYTDPAAETKPLLHLWSLGVEGHFYLIWPIVLLLAWRLVGPRRVAVVAALAALSLLANLIWTPQDPVAAFYLPLTRFWELALGTLIALSPRLLGKVSSPARHALSALGLGLIVVPMFWYTKLDSFPGWRAIMPVAGSAMLIATGPGAVINRAILSRRILVAIGLISYPLYLWHWALFTFGKYATLYFTERFELSILSTLALVAISVLLAWLTHRFVERPSARFALKGKGMRGLLGAWMLVILTSGGLWLGLSAAGITEGSKDTYLAQLQRKDGTCFVGVSLSEFDPVACITPEDGRTRVFLVGDSFVAGFSRTFNEDPSLAVSEFAASSCPFNPGLVSVVRPEACSEINQERMRLILEDTFDVIFIASWWGQQEMPGQMENLAATIDTILARTHARVVVYGPSPVFYSPVPDIYRRKVRGRETVVDTEVLTTYPELRQVAQATLTGKDRVRYIDVTGIFCGPDAMRCTYRDNTDLFFIDNSHLSLYGTRYVLERAGVSNFLHGESEVDE